MKKMTPLIAAAACAVTLSAQAYDADWKRGRIYYRSVCTSCHATTPVGAINPSSRTQAEWGAYLQGDKHAKAKDTVRFYFTASYRAAIRARNKAAEKFAATPEAELFEDVKAFLLRSAKDGESPAGCS